MTDGEKNLERETAGPSTALRFGRDDKGREGKIQRERKLAGCVKMGDLIRVHFFADLQQQMGVCFFQFSPCLRDAINLGKKNTFLERLCVAQSIHLRLFLLQRLIAANQGGSVLVKQIIHSFLLLGPQMERLGKVLVVPPAARGAKLQSSAHRSGGALLGRRIRWETLARIAGNSHIRRRASRDIRACRYTAPTRHSASGRWTSSAGSLGKSGQAWNGEQAPRQQQRANGRATHSHQLVNLGDGVSRDLFPGLANSSTEMRVCGCHRISLSMAIISRLSSATSESESAAWVPTTEIA